jgi:hypothetical protein
MGVKDILQERLQESNPANADDITLLIMNHGNGALT